MRAATAPRATTALLARRALPAPSDLDALALLRAHPGEPWFFWERPAAGEAVAAVGAAYAIEPAGEARFALAAHALSGLTFDRATDAPLLVGGFAFEAAHQPSGAWRGFPASRWWVPRLSYARRDGAASLVATCSGPAGRAARALDGGLERTLAALIRPLQLALPGAPRSYRLSAIDPPEAFRDAVGATLADIAAGRLEKLVLSRRCEITADRELSALRVLDRLRSSHPGCTIFAVGDGTSVLVGATPEMLARVADDRLETGAVAGTGRCGVDGEDAQLGRALLASVKNNHEHRLVVDDLRARLAPLCGEIEAPGEPLLLSTDTLRHLHTPLRARLRPGTGLLDVVAALHPTPALCGTPRETAAELLRQREGASRGWYGGGVGWLDERGGAVAVAIRGALLEGARALLYAGAGIVAGSSWPDEVEETRLKMRPLLAALLET